MCTWKLSVGKLAKSLSKINKLNNCTLSFETISLSGVFGDFPFLSSQCHLRQLASHRANLR